MAESRLAILNAMSTPELTVSVDPGECSGLSIFSHGFLIFCATYSNPIEFTHRIQRPFDLIIERPVIYPGPSSQKGDPNDLVTLGINAGEWKMRLSSMAPCRVFWYKPREWKGTIKKKAHNARVLGRLTAEELLVVPDLPAGKIHNAIDSIGLGLKHLRRLTPNQRVTP